MPEHDHHDALTPIRREVRRRATRTDLTGLFLKEILGLPPGEPSTEVLAVSQPRRPNSYAADPGMTHMQNKMVFIYESEHREDGPGWFVAVEPEICEHPSLGTTLFPPDGETRALRDAALENGARTCRWVSTDERRQREPDHW